MAERIDYSKGNIAWRQVQTKLKDGTVTEQWRIVIRGTSNGKRWTKSKLYPTSRNKDLTESNGEAAHPIKRKNAADAFIASLEEKQLAEEKHDREALAAQIAAEEARRAEELRLEAEQNKVGLIDFINEYVDAREAAGIIESSTATDYKHTSKRLEKSFADVALQDLTSVQVQEYETAELRRGVSPTTVGKAHRLLKQVITYAVNHEIITRNVMLIVEPPKRPKKKPNGLDISEAQRVTGILLNQRPTTVSTAAMLALHAGLRAGEVCGLTWADVDTKNKIIHIRRAVGLADGKGAYIKSTKNNSSTRDVNITDDLAHKLTQRRKLMREEAKRAEVLMTEQQLGALFVCGDINGKYPSPQVIARRWTVLAEEHNVIGTEGKRASFHTLRHGFATVGIASGIDVASIAAQMGHSTVSQTLNTYTSSTAAGKAQAAITMGEVMHPTKQAEVAQLKRTGTE